MANKQVKIEYKIYLEAEDVSQSRIRSCASFFQNILNNCNNIYFHNVKVDNESDSEDFALRLYVENTIDELDCKSEEDVLNFSEDMMDLLNVIAHANSFLEMDGSFKVSYNGEITFYTFTKESNQGVCEFTQA